MQQILSQLNQFLCAGETVVLVTVLEKTGSAPRGAGACMLVTAASRFGTIGGGAAEYAAEQQAKRALQTGEACRETFRLSPNEAADLGMVCGGTAQVLFHPICPTAENKAIFAALSDAVAAGADAYLLRRFAGNVCREMRVLKEKDSEWTFPTPVFVQTADGFAFSEQVSSASRVLVFGGGHVSQKLVPLLAFIGCRVSVYEDRAEFADAALFPDADRVILADYADISAFLAVGAEDCCVVMTRGHQADHTILVQLLKTPACYIGCIGSKKKIAVTRERLLADGFSEADFARIHTPIGLPIGAETPEEIAVSVAAELIAERAKMQRR